MKIRLLGKNATNSLLIICKEFITKNVYCEIQSVSYKRMTQILSCINVQFKHPKESQIG